MIVNRGDLKLYVWIALLCPVFLGFVRTCKNNNRSVPMVSSLVEAAFGSIHLRTTSTRQHQPQNPYLMIKMIMNDVSYSTTQATTARTTRSLLRVDKRLLTVQRTNSSRKKNWTVLNAKKDKEDSAATTATAAAQGIGGGASGKGFGKKSTVQMDQNNNKKQQQTSSSSLSSSSSSSSRSPSMNQNEDGSFFALQSIDDNNSVSRSSSSGSSSSPTTDDDSTMDDTMMTPEERASAILRNKYGLKTLAEQQLDAKQLEAYKERQSQVREWKKKVQQGNEDNDIDIITLIPPNVIIGIDLFLKSGVAIVGIIFIVMGLAITVEAYTKATGDTKLLSSDVETFIVNTIEPNFTKCLLVLLGFSISLGALAAAQLSSQGATYREEKNK